MKKECRKIGLVVISLIFGILFINLITASCTDSDNGRNYFQKGITSGSETVFFFSNEVVKTDSCLNSKVLKEYFCQNNNVVSENYICENGCSNWACLKQSAKVSVGFLNSLGNLFGVKWLFKEDVSIASITCPPGDTLSTLSDGITATCLMANGNIDYHFACNQTLTPSCYICGSCQPNSDNPGTDWCDDSNSGDLRCDGVCSGGDCICNSADDCKTPDGACNTATCSGTRGVCNWTTDADNTNCNYGDSLGLCKTAYNVYCDFNIDGSPNCDNPVNGILTSQCIPKCTVDLDCSGNTASGKTKCDNINTKSPTYQTCIIPPSCTEDKDCSAEKPGCDNGVCSASCSDSVDNTCGVLYPNQPYCNNKGSCVACLVKDNCVDSKMPVCSNGNCIATTPTLCDTDYQGSYNP